MAARSTPERGSITAGQIALGMELGNCEIRTPHGKWRLVVALYSDGTVGTVRAEGSSAGSWRVQRIDQYAEIR